MAINKYNQGVTLLISILVTSALLLVATGIVALAWRQSIISSAGEQSQYAFYAADTGAECALYFDIVGSLAFPGQSAFATTTPSNSMNCNRSSATYPDPTKTLNQYLVGGNGNGGVSHFTIRFDPEPYCAQVTVTKNPNGTTKIESLGYNVKGVVTQTSCGAPQNRRVERAVRVTY